MDPQERLQAGLQAMDELQRVGSPDEKLAATLALGVAARHGVTAPLTRSLVSRTISELADNVADRTTGHLCLSYTLGQVLAEIGSSPMDLDTEGLTETQLADVSDTYLDAIGQNSPEPKEAMLASVGAHHGYHRGFQTLHQLRQWNNPQLAPEVALGNVAAFCGGENDYLGAIAQFGEDPAVRSRAADLNTPEHKDGEEAGAFFWTLHDRARA